MRRAKMQSLLWSSPQELENQFYEALDRRDVNALMTCWSDEEEPILVAEEGQCLIGLGAIRAYFSALEGMSAAAPSWACRHRTDTMTTALHLLTERHAGQSGAASEWHVTHVYHRTARGWHLVSRHLSRVGTAETAQHVPIDSRLH